MTIIAYRDGVMAADSLATAGDRITGHVKKVFKVMTPRGPEVFGVAGAATYLPLIRAYLEGKGPIPMPNDVERGLPQADRHGYAVLVASQNGVRIICDGCEGEASVAPYHVIGCGAEFAQGALAVGKSAEDAVKAAIECSPWCGGDVQAEKVDK